ncbi:MAG: hypothetical protein N2578_04380 [Bdellovibrionaceae bacterium]|nr:hypothetical protein [Pseudobdellovibrionaceae bacterium]
MDRFFVSCPLGSERATAREIEEVWPWLLGREASRNLTATPKFHFYEGGVEFAAEMFLGLQLNFFLKTAGRILLRLAQFRVRDFGQLAERMARVPLETWLSGPPDRIEIASTASRVFHKGRIEETVRQAISKRRFKNPTSSHRLYLRLSHNQLTVSLDTSGEHLHRRGVRTYIGEAPLRETLAALCLRALIRDRAPAELGGIRLVDPFCGSGTFLLESATLWQPNFQRKYAFQSWLRCPRLFRIPGFEKNYRLFQSPSFQSLLGFDIDPHAIEAAQKNCAALSHPRAEFFTQDILTAQRQSSLLETWVITNPPYGDRVPLPAGPRQLVQRILDAFTPARLGILWPEHLLEQITSLNALKPHGKFKMKNGGRDVTFAIYDCQNLLGS